MSGSSTIEWTNATWNPVVGCTAVSPGCDHCYAAREASGRLRGTPTYAGLAEGGVFNGTMRLLPERLDQPLHWRRPRRIFVNSMSDLFHADVPEDFISRVWSVMDRASQHTFQVLTKRAERMERVVTRLVRDHAPARGGDGRLPLNVWLGVSVESPVYYSRIRHLQRTPAAARFLSCEPLLAPLPDLPLDDIDWVIVGGESGPGARPMHPDWVRDIRDQCQRAGVAFFFKQWGEWAGEPDGLPITPSTDGHVFEDGTQMMRLGKKRAGRVLDGRTWDEMPAEATR